MAHRVAVGTLKLKANVTRKEVRKLCDMLRELGDPEWLAGERGADEHLVRAYDDEHGDPTSFYIP